MRYSKDILKTAWPIFISNLAMIGNGVADTIMLGHYRSEHLAAMSIAISIYATTMLFLSGILYGLSPLMARAWGAEKPLEVGVLARQGLLLALLLGLTGMVILSFPQQLLGWVGAPVVVAAIASDYLRIIAFSLPASLLARVYFCLAPAVNRARLVMLVDVIAISVKLPLSWLFIFGHWGFSESGSAGAALASTLSSWVSLVAFLVLLRRDPLSQHIQLWRGSYRPNFFTQCAILKIGVPIAISMLVDVTSYTFMALFLAPLGVVVSGAHQIAANLGALLYMFPLAVSVASSVKVAQYLGANDVHHAKSAAYAGMKLSFGVSLLVATTLFIARHQIVQIYTFDTGIALLASSLLMILAVFHVLDSQLVLLMHLFRSWLSGKTSLLLTSAPTVLFALALWGVGMPGGWWLALRGFKPYAPQGAAGFWMMLSVSYLLANAMLYALYFWLTQHGGTPDGKSRTVEAASTA